MTHPHAAAHDGHHGADTPPASALFSPPEWERIRTDDRIAARQIVGLMVAIFVMGLIGYIGICIWAA